jgi:hypothetical protein
MSISCGERKKTNGKEAEKITGQETDTSVYAETDNMILPDLTEKNVSDENFMLNASVKDILVDIRWYCSWSGGELLKFHRNSTWTLTDWHGLGEFVKGSYTISNDSAIILDLSNVEYSYTGVLNDYPYPAMALKKLFGEEPEFSFVLQRDYTDFYAIGRLYNERFDKTFISSIQSPENERYELDGVIVTKKSGNIIIEETLFTKKEPFDDADEIRLPLTDRFERFNEYLIEDKTEIDIVLPGEVFNYDALYNAENNKTWYRIRIDNFMSYDNAWICGGSVHDISENSKTIADYDKIFNTLVELGYINTSLMER